MKEKYFVILAVMVVGTVVAVGFVLWSNRNLPAETLTKIQKAANPCLGLSADLLAKKPKTGYMGPVLLR